MALERKSNRIVKGLAVVLNGQHGQELVAKRITLARELRHDGARCIDHRTWLGGKHGVMGAGCGPDMVEAQQRFVGKGRDRDADGRSVLHRRWQSRSRRGSGADRRVLSASRPTPRLCRDRAGWRRKPGKETACRWLLPGKSSDLTICATLQPHCAAASSAVRVEAPMRSDLDVEAGVGRCLRHAIDASSHEDSRRSH